MHKIIHLPIEVNVNKTVKLFVFFVSKDLNQSIHSRPLLTCERSMSVNNCRQLCGIVIDTNYATNYYHQLRIPIFLFPSNLRYLTFSVEAKNWHLRERPWLITSYIAGGETEQHRARTHCQWALAYCHIDSHLLLLHFDLTLLLRPLYHMCIKLFICP